MMKYRIMQALGLSTAFHTLPLYQYSDKSTTPMDDDCNSSACVVPTKSFFETQEADPHKMQNNFSSISCVHKVNRFNNLWFAYVIICGKIIVDINDKRVVAGDNI